MNRAWTIVPAAAGLLVLLGAAPVGQAPRPDKPAGESSAPVAAVRVTIETIVVDRRGTQSLGTEVADIFSGSSGVLKKSATLISRTGNDVREMVELTARLSPTLSPDGGCALRLEAETRSVLAGAKAGARPRPPDRVRAAVVLKPYEEKLVEAYSSSVTQGKIAFRLRCGTPDADQGPEAQFVDFVLSVSRGEGDQEPKPMKTNGLRALVGHEASNHFSFNVTLDPDASGARRYRKEEVDVSLTPVLISGGRIQVLVNLQGELATVTAQAPPVSHPISHVETLVVSPGQAQSLDIDVRSSGDAEGWLRVRYRLGVNASF
jgi:hypothetical protein